MIPCPFFFTDIFRTQAAVRRAVIFKPFFTIFAIFVKIRFADTFIRPNLFMVQITGYLRHAGHSTAFIIIGDISVFDIADTGIVFLNQMIPFLRAFQITETHTAEIQIIRTAFGAAVSGVSRIAETPFCIRVIFSVGIAIQLVVIIPFFVIFITFVIIAFGRLGTPLAIGVSGIALVSITNTGGSTFRRHRIRVRSTRIFVITSIGITKSVIAGHTLFTNVLNLI